MKRILKFFSRPAYDIESEIIDEIRSVKKQLHDAQLRFDYESDTDLIDSAIFEVSSLTARYRYLMRLAREMEIDSGDYTPQNERSDKAWVHF